MVKNNTEKMLCDQIITTAGKAKICKKECGEGDKKCDFHTKGKKARVSGEAPGKCIKTLVRGDRKGKLCGKNTVKGTKFCAAHTEKRKTEKPKTEKPKTEKQKKTEIELIVVKSPPKTEDRELVSRRSTIERNIQDLERSKKTENKKELIEKKERLVSRLIQNHINFMETRYRQSKNTVELMGDTKNTIVLRKIRDDLTYNTQNLKEDLKKYKKYLKEPLRESIGYISNKPTEEDKKIQKELEIVSNNWDAMIKGDWIMLDVAKEDASRKQSVNEGVDMQATYEQEAMARGNADFEFDTLSKSMKSLVEKVESLMTILKVDGDAKLNKIAIASEIAKYQKDIDIKNKNDELFSVAGVLLKHLQKMNVTPSFIHKCEEFTWDNGGYMYCILETFVLKNKDTAMKKKVKGKGKSIQEKQRDRFAEILRLQGFKAIPTKKKTTIVRVSKIAQKTNPEEIFKLGRMNKAPVRMMSQIDRMFQQPKFINLQKVQNDETARTRTNIIPIAAKPRQVEGDTIMGSVSPPRKRKQSVKSINTRNREREERISMLKKKKDEMMKRREAALGKTRSRKSSVSSVMSRRGSMGSQKSLNGSATSRRSSIFEPMDIDSIQGSAASSRKGTASSDELGSLQSLFGKISI
jgi:hypothetical protein